MPLRRISDLTAVSTVDDDSLIEVSEPTGASPPYVSKRATLAEAVIGWAASEGDIPLPAWSVDLDFTTGIYWTAPYNSPNPLTVSRASVGYIDTIADVWSQVPANTLRRSNKGALVEEARTNSLRNNSMQGAVAGSPGTLPTNWNVTPIGLTQTIGTPTTENGVDVIDIRLNGTTTSGNAVIAFEATTQIAAAVGQAWAGGAFVKLQAGSIAGFTSFQFRIQEHDAAGASLLNGGMATFTPTGTLTRVSDTRTLTQAGTAFVRLTLLLAVPTATAVDITLRLGWPQLELGDWASSPIRTTSAAATRAADIITAPAPPPFGAAMSLAGAGTIVGTTGGFNLLATATDATQDNQIAVRRTAAGNLSGIVTVAGTNVFNVNLAVWPQNTPGTLAVAAAANSQAAAANGGNLTTGAAAGIPTGINHIRIGSNTSGGQQFNGYITRVLAWPETRLGNARVKSVSAELPQAAGWISDVGRSTVDGSGLRPASTPTAGWAITSNYDGGGEVDLWSTVNQSGAGQGFYFWQKLTDSTEYLLAQYFGDGSTFAQFNIGGPPLLAWVAGADASSAYVGTSSDGPFTLFTNNVNRVRVNAGAFETDFLGGTQGQAIGIKSKTELTVIAAAAFTDTTIQFPAGSIGLGVSVRSNVGIPTATTYDVGVSGATTRYATGVSDVVGTTATKATMTDYASATSVRITPNATPASNTGRVRVTLYYFEVTPPTS